MQRIVPLAIAVLSVLGLLFMSTFYGKKYFILNQTASLPRGFYRIIERQDYNRGDLVAFHIPDTIRTFIESKFQLPRDAYLMKHVVGIPGDSYSITNGEFVVQGELIGDVLSTDPEGKPMPLYEYNGILDRGLLVAKKGLNTSIDSRYFGPIAQGDIIGIAKPLLLFE